MKKKILKFNNFMINEEYTGREKKLIDSVLDRIGEVGFEHLSSREKDILTKYSKKQSISEYLPKEKDGVEITFDNKGMLFNGLPYEEYKKREREGLVDDVQDDDGFKSTSKSKADGRSESWKTDYKIRIYKDYSSRQRTFYIFHKDGKKDKYRTVSDREGEIFGKFTTLKTWQGLSMKEAHDKYLDKEFDQYRELNPSETSELETLMVLRKRWRSGELNPTQPKRDKKGKILKELSREQIEDNDEKEKFMDELKRLYKKFSNI